jgi:hypothetical protein
MFVRTTTEKIHIKAARFYIASRTLHIEFKIFGMDELSGYASAAHGYAGIVNGGGIAGHQGMPVFQRSVFSQPAVGTGLGQPFYLPDIVFGQSQAIGVGELAILIDEAFAFFGFQKLTGDANIFDLTAGGIFDFLKTADAAAVAQRFPLFRRHFLQRQSLIKARFFHSGGIRAGQPLHFFEPGFAFDAMAGCRSGFQAFDMNGFFTIFAKTVLPGIDVPQRFLDFSDQQLFPIAEMMGKVALGHLNGVVKQIGHVLVDAGHAI